MAHALATAATNPQPPGDSDRVVNANVVLRFDTLGSTLSDNRAQLVAQNMLKEGHTKAEADRDVSLLLELIGWFDHMDVSLDTTRSELRASLDLVMKSSDQAVSD
jgi:hypothetical protein